MMEQYFETQIGKKLVKAITTGKNFYTEVYKRQYTIEVLGVKNGRVLVDVNSVDITPSGYPEGDSRQYLGEVWVAINKESKNETIYDIIAKVDLMFLRRYSIKAI